MILFSCPGEKIIFCRDKKEATEAKKEAKITFFFPFAVLGSPYDDPGSDLGSNVFFQYSSEFPRIRETTPESL